MTNTERHETTMTRDTSRDLKRLAAHDDRSISYMIRKSIIFYIRKRKAGEA